MAVSNFHDSKLTLKKPRNLAHALAEALTHEIRSGQRKPDSQLPTESAIMELHGVSRTVVREALSQLNAAGLVQTRHGIGTFVLEAPANISALSADTILTLRDVQAVLELRISMETEAAWLAATRRSDEQLAQMAVALADMQAGQEVGHQVHGNSVNADVRFHLLIAQATGNRYFVEILTHLGTTIIPRARINSAQLTQDHPAAYLERVNREHEDIYQAILRQDAEGARAAMRIHLSNSRERLQRVKESIETTLDP